MTPELKCLGSIFTEDGKLAEKIKIRCQKIKTLIYHLSPLLKYLCINMQTLYTTDQKLSRANSLIPMSDPVTKKGRGKKDYVRWDA